MLFSRLGTPPLVSFLLISHLVYLPSFLQTLASEKTETVHTCVSCVQTQWCKECKNPFPHSTRTILSSQSGSLNIVSMSRLLLRSTSSSRVSSAHTSRRLSGLSSSRLRRRGSTLADILGAITTDGDEGHHCGGGLVVNGRYCARFGEDTWKIG